MIKSGADLISQAGVSGRWDSGRHRKTVLGFYPVTFFQRFRQRPEALTGSHRSGLSGTFLERRTRRTFRDAPMTKSVPRCERN